VIYIIIKLAANNLAVCQLCSEKALKEVLVQMEKLVEFLHIFLLQLHPKTQNLSKVVFEVKSNSFSQK